MQIESTQGENYVLWTWKGYVTCFNKDRESSNSRPSMAGQSEYGIKTGVLKKLKCFFFSLIPFASSRILYVLSFQQAV